MLVSGVVQRPPAGNWCQDNIACAIGGRGSVAHDVFLNNVAASVLRWLLVGKREHAVCLGVPFGWREGEKDAVIFGRENQIMDIKQLFLCVFVGNRGMNSGGTQMVRGGSLGR